MELESLIYYSSRWKNISNTAEITLVKALQQPAHCSISKTAEPIWVLIAELFYDSDNVQKQEVLHAYWDAINKQIDQSNIYTETSELVDSFIREIFIAALSSTGPIESESDGDSLPPAYNVLEAFFRRIRYTLKHALSYYRTHKDAEAAFSAIVKKGISVEEASPYLVQKKNSRKKEKPENALYLNHSARQGAQYFTAEARPIVQSQYCKDRNINISANKLKDFNSVVKALDHVCRIIRNADTDPKTTESNIVEFKPKASDARTEQLWMLPEADRGLSTPILLSRLEDSQTDYALHAIQAYASTTPGFLLTKEGKKRSDKNHSTNIFNAESATQTNNLKELLRLANQSCVYFTSANQDLNDSGYTLDDTAAFADTFDMLESVEAMREQTDDEEKEKEKEKEKPNDQKTQIITLHVDNIDDEIDELIIQLINKYKQHKTEIAPENNEAAPKQSVLDRDQLALACCEFLLLLTKSHVKVVYNLVYQNNRFETDDDMQAIINESVGATKRPLSIAGVGKHSQYDGGASKDHLKNLANEINAIFQQLKELPKTLSPLELQTQWHQLKPQLVEFVLKQQKVHALSY